MNERLTILLGLGVLNKRVEFLLIILELFREAFFVFQRVWKRGQSLNRPRLDLTFNGVISFQHGQCRVQTVIPFVFGM